MKANKSLLFLDKVLNQTFQKIYIPFTQAIEANDIDSVKAQSTMYIFILGLTHFLRSIKVPASRMVSTFRQNDPIRSFWNTYKLTSILVTDCKLDVDTASSFVENLKIFANMESDEDLAQIINELVGDDIYVD